VCEFLFGESTFVEFFFFIDGMIQRRRERHGGDRSGQRQSAPLGAQRIAFSPIGIRGIRGIWS
jgi:hypothetical protein